MVYTEMVTVKVKGSANEIMDIVRDLRADGLAQGIDFDFKFHQTFWSWDSNVVPAHAAFTFYHEKYGTFFSLRHSERLM